MNVQVTLNITPGALQKIEELRVKGNHADTATVFRHALAAYDAFLSETLKGNKIFTGDASGDLAEIVFVDAEQEPQTEHYSDPLNTSGAVQYGITQVLKEMGIDTAEVHRRFVKFIRRGETK